MKTCPCCAEQIQEAALLCRYCRSRLDGRDGAGTRLARLLVAAGIIGLAASLVVPALRPRAAAAMALPASVGDQAGPACPAPVGGHWLPPGHPPIDGMMDRALRLPLGQLPVGASADWPAGTLEL